MTGFFFWQECANSDNKHVEWIEQSLRGRNILPPPPLRPPSPPPPQLLLHAATTKTITITTATATGAVVAAAAAAAKKISHTNIVSLRTVKRDSGKKRCVAYQEHEHWEQVRGSIFLACAAPLNNLFEKHIS